MIEHFRLGCVVPVKEDGTSHGRACGPLGAMSRECSGLQLKFPPQTSKGIALSWEFLSDCHGLFLQRPCGMAMIEYIKVAKAMNIPVWIDWDDDFGSVPMSNPNYSSFIPFEITVKSIGLMIQMADFVTTSTPHLQSVLMAYAGGDCETDIIVIPNACQFPVRWMPRRKVVSWRGSNTHDEDVATVLPELAEISHAPECFDWKFHFSGDPPWEINQVLRPGCLERSPGYGPVMFTEFFPNVAPHVHIIPLRDSQFNRSKSNIAWVEATAAGAVCLAPDWPEWQRPGIINYGDDFKEKLLMLMSEWTEKPHVLVQRSMEHIEQNLMLKRVNQQRWNVIERMRELTR